MTEAIGWIFWWESFSPVRKVDQRAAGGHHHSAGDHSSAIIQLQLKARPEGLNPDDSMRTDPASQIPVQEEVLTELLKESRGGSIVGFEEIIFRSRFSKPSQIVGVWGRMVNGGGTEIGNPLRLKLLLPLIQPGSC
jgi:hypothetical protein